MAHSRRRAAGAACCCGQRDDGERPRAYDVTHRGQRSVVAAERTMCQSCQYQRQSLEGDRAAGGWQASVRHAQSLDSSALASQHAGHRCQLAYQIRLVVDPYVDLASWSMGSTRLDGELTTLTDMLMRLRRDFPPAFCPTCCYRAHLSPVG